MVMTIDQAIEIKIQWRKNNYPPPLADEMNADMLSIEALEFIKRSRAFGEYPVNRQLPSETKPVYRGMTETMFINPERD